MNRMAEKKRKNTYPGPGFVSEPDYELPVLAGRVVSQKSINGCLPTNALMAGYELREVNFAFDDDPWYLYDPEGRKIKEWKLRPPSLAEVREVCEALMVQ